MLILGIMCLGIFIGSRFFPAAQKEKNEALQLFCTLILIFSMGIGLGQWEGFLEELMRLGLQSFLFCLIPTVLSILFVQFLARRFMVCKGRETATRGSRDQAEAVSETEPKGAPGGTDFMVFFALGALLAGDVRGVAACLANNLAPAARALCPEAGEVEAWLRSQPGVLAAQVTGSGTCSFALCESAAAADAIAAAAVSRGWRSWSTKVLGSSTEVC